MKRISKEFNPANKRSVANLHKVITFLQDGEIDADEASRRVIGTKTRDAIRGVLAGAAIPDSGRLTPELINQINDKLIDKKYREKVHIAELHRNLTVLSKKKFIKLELADNEINTKKIGPSTRTFIKAFQKKYKLTETGKINAATDEKLESVITSIAGSKPQRKKLLKTKKPSELTRTVHYLRLNMKSEKVQKLQKNLVWLGYKIHNEEYTSQIFGKTTREAVKQFQTDHVVPVTGRVDSVTAKALNKELGKTNPQFIRCDRYRIRGSVRDDLWKGKSRVTVQIYEKGLRGHEVLMGEKKTFKNGFYDILYQPPIDPQTKKPKSPLHVVVKIVDNVGTVIDAKTYYKVNKVHWVNFTEGPDRYLGPSEYEQRMKALAPSQKAANLKIEELEQSDTKEDIVFLYRETGMLPEDIMRLSLAHRIAKEINKPSLPAPLFYSLLHQNLPPETPSDLFPDEPKEWSEWMSWIVHLLTNGLVFLEKDIQKDAVDNAFERNLLPHELKSKKDNILQVLNDLREDFVLTKPLLVGDGNLKTLLETSGLNSSKFSLIVKTFINQQGITEAFWEELETAGSLNTPEFKELKTTVDLGFIAKNHPPTVTVLKAKIDDVAQGNFRSSRDFAKLTQKGWEDLIEEGGGGVPAYIDSVNAVERLKTYAATMKSQAERLHPAVALVAEVGRNNEHGLSHVSVLSQFMDNVETFDLMSDNIQKQNDAHGNPLNSNALQEAMVIQRILRFAPSAAVGTALLNEKLHSSMQIYFRGQDRLIETLEARGAQRFDIIRVYRFAEHQYAHALAKLLQFRFDFFRDSPVAVPDLTYSPKEIEEFKKDIPNIEVLFGSVDYCDCEHCSSVYSPAAYLTDLLRFLEEKSAIPANKTVRDILLSRRPDIANVKLNCENTHTPLPYIDLVNEILENAIPPSNSNFSYQTTLSAEELRAIPEHVREHAYTELKNSTFPMSVSFNLWQEETRMFLEHLGVPRHLLMEDLQNRSDIANKTPKNVEIAAEFFGISSQEQEIILPSTLEATALKQNEYWGFDSTQTAISVSSFLEKSKLKYDQLLELLQVKLVNPEINHSIINRPVDDCDVDKQTIDNITLPKLDKMHRFIRMWRRSGWEMWELDLLIRNAKVGNGVLDGNCLVELRRAKLLQKKLGLSVEELLGFYGPINTEVRVSTDAAVKEILPLYHRLFLNLAVSNPVHPNFELPIPAGGALNGPGHSSTILSALAITDKDFNLLVPLTDGQLSVASLSQLYRYVMLAKKLRLSIKDLQQLMSITDVSDPFATLEQTREFLKYYKAIKAAGFSLLDLNYALNHVPDSAAGLRDEVIIQYMGILRASLNGLRKDLLESNDTSRKLLEKHLSKITLFSDQDTLTKALDLIEGKWGDDESSRETFIDDNFAEFIPASANAKTTLTKESYYDGDQLTKAEEDAIVVRYNYVLHHLYLYLNSNLITEHVASYLSLSNQHTNILLEKTHLSGSPLTLRQHLQAEAFTARNEDGSFVNSIDCTTFPEICRVYRLVHKQSIFLDKFDLKVKELTWFIDHHNDIESLNLESLPVSASPPSSLFGKWWNWWRILEFKQLFPEPEEITLFDILEAGIDGASDITDLLSQLATLTQWEISNLTDLHQGLGFKHNDTDHDYIKPETYHRLWSCFKHMRHTGVDAKAMFAWSDRSDETQDLLIAQATRQASKSKYEVKEWLNKVQPIEDELREKKRNALIAFLIERSLRNEPEMVLSGGNDIPNPKYWEDMNDLFVYFLIDVGMSACQLTSRIKQAISSVQLFVQRCFLNLEGRFVKVPKDDPDLDNSWKQWKWMQNYRIWEANRKVFLYPENWIEPELRDDKSPFFKELEDEILQKEITHDNVEQAFLSYLNKVDEVSHLEVVGVYHDFHGPKEEVHVIGRTKTFPHTYYHRIYDLDYFVWSPWEKIEVDITGDHAIPVVYNRKLHLFWLVFEEKPEKIKKNPPAKGSDSTSENPEPSRILEIQLAWTVKKHNGWSPKAMSKNKLIHPWQRPYHSYHIKPRYKDSDNTLWIDLFISTSEEFNDTLFYDQFVADKVKRTKTGYNQTYRPWHSSSFVFDGNVQKIKLRGLRSWQTIKIPIPKIENGNLSIDYLAFDYQYSDSYTNVSQNYGQEGRVIEELLSSERAGRLLLPPGMHFEYNHLSNNRIHNKNSRKLNLPHGLTKTLLQGANTPFQVVLPMQSLASRPFVYQDSERAMFVKAESKELLQDYQTKLVTRYVFYNFYHPYTTLFIRELNRTGLDGLLNRRIQIRPESFFPKNTFDFKSVYKPREPHQPDVTSEKDIVDFSFGGAYSIYNWELFFHAPMMIAGKLSQNQRFEEATRWYHYIFDPTNTENLPVPQRYWVTKPFYEHTAKDYRQQRIQNLIKKIDEFGDQVKAWKNNPFKPHLIARYRPVAYQRNVVMKYIDNIVAWGDQLFRRDTLESINQASLLYMLAYEILGDKPKRVPAIPRTDKTFDELTQEGPLDIFGNNKIEVNAENELGLPIRVVASTEGTEPLPRLETLYFCIPRNDKLVTYWDTVEDRLFKIRNCMNIEGIVRQLPLFAPPIDPALLVKASAAGLDLGSVLNDLSVSNPNYRFRTLLQAAVQFCGEVKALGEKLLAVLERKDAEGLAILHSTHEIQLLEEVKNVRALQVDEADENIKAMEASWNIAEERRLHYEGVPYMNYYESAASKDVDSAFIANAVSGGLNAGAAILHLIPTFNLGGSGVGGSPHGTCSWGGGNLAGFASSSAAVAQNFVQKHQILAGEHEKQANLTRTYDANQLQKRLAEKEKLQINKQKLAAEIKKEIAEKEEENQQLQIDNTKTEDEYLRNKYTNAQLYNWMLTQVSTVYFQAYQVAYDMAKRAEKSFRYELSLQNSGYIQFGYWDSLKKGLLSGDKLMNDLQRMEAAYYDQHKRELELTKHISLAQVSPWHLMELRMTGHCTLELPEWLFDMDYPGHYMRRIKAVSVSIPCVTGPYSGIHCTMSLHNSRIRVSDLVGSSYDMTDASDDRFRHEYGTIQSIATSHGQNDTGLFELNFSDDRFFPFEGAGVLSTWSIKMPQVNNQFDFDTISDFIIHIQYTARDGGANLAMAAQSSVNSILPQNGMLLLSVKHQFPDEWHRFLYPSTTGADQDLKLVLNKEHYPFYSRNATNLKVSKMNQIIIGQHANDYIMQIQLPGQPAAEEVNVKKDANLNDVHHKEHVIDALPDGKGEWSIKIRRHSDTGFKSLPTDNIDDLLLVIQYQTS